MFRDIAEKLVTVSATSLLMTIASKKTILKFDTPEPNVKL